MADDPQWGLNAAGDRRPVVAVHYQETMFDRWVPTIDWFDVRNEDGGRLSLVLTHGTAEEQG
ncbi:MAG: hypothetical protein ABMB14_03940 [Myxococcota bacterium]